MMIQTVLRGHPVLMGQSFPWQWKGFMLHGAIGHLECTSVTEDRNFTVYFTLINLQINLNTHSHLPCSWWQPYYTAHVWVNWIILWPPDAKSWLIGKDTDAVKDGRQEKAAAEVGWHHQHNGHESEQIPGAGEGQGSLACCSPRCCQQLDTTEGLNNRSLNITNECLWPVLYERRAWVRVDILSWGKVQLSLTHLPSIPCGIICSGTFQLLWASSSHSALDDSSYHSQQGKMVQKTTTQKILSPKPAPIPHLQITQNHSNSRVALTRISNQWAEGCEQITSTRWQHQGLEYPWEQKHWPRRTENTEAEINIQ